MRDAPRPRAGLALVPTEGAVRNGETGGGTTATRARAEGRSVGWDFRPQVRFAGVIGVCAGPAGGEPRELRMANVVCTEDAVDQPGHVGCGRQVQFTAAGLALRRGTAGGCRVDQPRLRFAIVFGKGVLASALRSPRRPAAERSE
ncbi:hypothetical protein GCM10012275_33350 [Longimycelium tulufanense]|uniref:Uncharacterized protein n=1 Tax=Longimycelium tulufanense TaxID=907463 RepID=A0A8J3C9C4_9PSEU|nr:hypothetical protein GCM10012275_33350 [Longimycelium tulufanense]